MEIIQTIWTALITPNANLCNIIIAPLSIIEILVGMLLFTTLLDIKATKKQKTLYVILISIWTMIANYLIPKPYGTYLNMLIAPIAVYFIFKGTIIKSIASMLIVLVTATIFETIIGKIYFSLLSIPYNIVASVPIYRISLALLIYLCMFFVYKAARKFNFQITLKNIKITQISNKILLLLNFVLGIIATSTQAYLMALYGYILPIPIVIATTLSLISYFIISIYSLLKASKLEITTENLEESKLYNKTLELLHDNTKAFKHDFNNIIQALGGYIDANDIEGLKKYYKDLNKECIETNNLSALSPKVINNPAIYSILASKYYEADKYDIKINLDIFLDLNTLNMKTYQFTRILGILLDNAIEASKECDEKIINVSIRNDNKVNRQLLIIENTYSNKDVDTEKIFEKGFTSKPTNTGVGLWEVRQILKKNKNLNLFTSKDDKYFKQQLEIY